MVSRLDICNMALAQLGQESISSIDQDDERARRCLLFYEPVKQEVLRTHNWAFANGQTALELVESAEAQEAGYYAYAYPQDGLFLRKVFCLGKPEQAVSFKEIYLPDMQTRVIWCKLPQAHAEYTRNVSEEDLFDPAFVKAFSLALATDLAVSLTADLALSQRILQKYTLALEEARRSNMTENYEIHQGQSCFVEQR